jgi:hypothetical protein
MAAQIGIGLASDNIYYVNLCVDVIRQPFQLLSVASPFGLFEQDSNGGHHV